LRYLKYFASFILIIFLFQSCEKEDNSVIDPRLTFPQITFAFVNPTSVSSASINAIVSAVVVSEDGIASVTGKIFDPINAEVLTVQLKDDGVSPDTTVGDGRFTANITYSPSCVIVGDYKIELVAVGSGGTSSNVVNVTLNVFQSGNLQPSISNLIITPDSVSVSDTTFFIFMVTATDPNGQCDIRRVFYTGFRPDNTELTPQGLFDDGSCCIIPPFNSTSGDTTANDTKFTRKFFGNSPQTGYYRYFMKAIDMSDDTSNILSDSIYVYP